MVAMSGARAYYFRSILHDYESNRSLQSSKVFKNGAGPDAECRQTLRETSQAMTQGHSKLLINDWVLQDLHSPLLPSLYDINMICFFSARERTLNQWTALLDSVGLEIAEVYGADPHSEGVIEAVLK